MLLLMICFGESERWHQRSLSYGIVLSPRVFWVKQRALLSEALMVANGDIEIVPYGAVPAALGQPKVVPVQALRPAHARPYPAIHVVEGVPSSPSNLRRVAQVMR
jgi:hypothetical protein